MVLLGCTTQMVAQPQEADIYRMLDSYDFGQPGDQPPVSVMVDADHTTVDAGTFMIKDRNEYLVQLLLVKDGLKKQFAFIAYPNGTGGWNRSNWFIYGYTHLESTDIETNGVSELIHKVDLPGNRRNQQRYRILSIQGDEETEIYKVDGFSTNANYYVRAGAGDHMSSVFEVELIDTDGDGVKEISETITDEYFQFQYDNINLNQEFDKDHEAKGDGYQRRTTVYKVKRGNLEVLEVK